VPACAECGELFEEDCCCCHSDETSESDEYDECDEYDEYGEYDEEYDDVAATY
jgi:hypothetical protein